MLHGVETKKLIENTINMKNKHLVSLNKKIYTKDEGWCDILWGEISISIGFALGEHRSMDDKKWFLSVGSGDKKITVRGDYVIGVVECEDKPDTSFKAIYLAQD